MPKRRSSSWYNLLENVDGSEHALVTVSDVALFSRRPCVHLALNLDLPGSGAGNSRLYYVYIYICV